MSTTLAGAQVVGRLAAVLRAVSTSMPQGITTTQVAQKTALPRPTVHRLLTALVAEGFCDHDQETGHWLLGPELYLMGAVAAERYDISELAREHVAALADATGESAFLSARRGDETVCLVRQDGAFPVRSFVLYEGRRFPLGVASAGIAILAFLPEAEVEDYLKNNNLVPEYGAAHSAKALRAKVAETRTLGYSVNPGLIVEGSWGMGAAVFDASGQPAWALSLTGIQSRFEAPRRKELGRLLLHHAHELSTKLRNSPGAMGR
ncbi:IclR family transcriptional regulator [Glutamicibacter sp.]|uniref:IclR family transcriptional regulator n=1 Tax=Glutamicibacter sp. TaxID=1931995 RepID=UPI0028BE38FC|nr:IclR family transcriptional regulator [Glutamicibacter sp.]